MNPTSLYVQTACLWEATARKVGNVHPGCDFNDTSFVDFAISAAVIGPVLARPESVGQNILDAVNVTRFAVGKNTNLGLILAIAPLAFCPRGVPLADSIRTVIAAIDLDETARVFEAIRLANPGGLGTDNTQDVRESPRISLRKAMELAVDRDQIAVQFAFDFRDVIGFGVDHFHRSYKDFGRVEPAIIDLQLAWLAKYGDSLIRRKCGTEMANAIRRQAESIQKLGGIRTADGRRKATEFDQLLRSSGNRLNPGTTADLIGAVLFAALHDRIVSPTSPFRWEQVEWLSGTPSA